MTRLEKLKALEQTLLDMMETANSRSMAALARQYRETIYEIDLIEGGEDEDDEIATIILRHRQPGTDTSSDT